MSIRRRIEEVTVLSEAGYTDAALLIALVAVAAASRRKYPRNVIKSDGDAFKTYLEERISATLTHGQNAADTSFMLLNYKQQHTISDVLYHEFRCNLFHEGELPHGTYIDANTHDLSVRFSDDGLVLGKGWLNLLCDIVVNDPNLRPTFDDVRRASPDDLRYKGAQDEPLFLQEFQDAFYLSSGRIEIIKKFVAHVGTRRLRQMNDDELRMLWDREVAVKPEDFSLDVGSLVGLSLIGGDYRGIEIVSQAPIITFLRQDRPLGFSITNKGIAAIRAIIQNYESTPSAARQSN